MNSTTLGSLRVRMVGELSANRDVIVLMHGFGATGEDLVGLSEVLEGSNRTFVFPEAPLSLGREYGPGARAWWPIDMARLQLAMMAGTARDIAKEDPEELPYAKAKVLQLLSELREKGARSIVLGGFSQGAMLATDIALTTSIDLQGVILWSSSLLRESVWNTANIRNTTSEALPILMSHGEFDPILPFENSQRLHDLLVTKGYAPEFVQFRGAHEIPPKAIVATQRFLAKTLARASE